MTTAIAEENAATETGSDSVESMLDNFDLGDVAGDVAGEVAGEDSAPGEPATAEVAAESAAEIIAMATTAASQAAAPSTAGDNMAEINAADPISPESARLIELQQQIDRLTSELSMRKFSDREISAQSARVRELSDEVRDCESSVKEAKGELTATKERYESAVRELRSMLDDRSRGQRRFPLETANGKAGETTDAAQSAATAAKSVGRQIMEAAAAKINAGELDTPDCKATAEVGGGSSNGEAGNPSSHDDHAVSPISVLAQKQMISTFGQDLWEAAKNRKEPFGMGKAELEALEAAELTTIGELEKRMREDAWWFKKLPKFGEKKVQKLIESLRVWRGKFPMPA